MAPERFYGFTVVTYLFWMIACSICTILIKNVGPAILNFSSLASNWG